jgi:tRNA A37 methylthiotransferase MiaB
MPKIGFVSLGCPKALVDSERILTQLRTEGYDIVPTYDRADVVVVNTCGFIDEAKAESLEAIGEAIEKNGKVIVTGCLGVQADDIRARQPQVLEITGPQAYDQVEGGRAVGRSSADAPDIDGCVYLQDRGFQPGDMIEAVVENSDDYDLWARPSRPHITPVSGKLAQDRDG